MKKLRIVAVLMGLVIAINIVYPYKVQAQEETLTIENLVLKLNEEIKKAYSRNNYYVESVIKDGKEKELSYSLLKGQLANMNKVLKGEGNDKDLNQSMLFRIAYGEPFTISENKQEEEEYLGLNPELNYVENPKYKWNSWDGKRLDEMVFMKEPWKKEYIPVRQGRRDTLFNERRDADYKCPDGTIKTLTDAVQEGMNIRYANKKGSDVSKSGSSKVVYLQNHKPKGGGEWIDYVDIVQPPTYYTWGQGYLYSADGMRYKGVAIAPYSLLKSDLWVETEDVIPVEERHLNEVTVSGLIKSNFPKDIETDFEWKIIGSKTGTPVKVLETIGYGGIDTLSGKCIVPGKQNSANFEVTFIMPKEPVEISFTVNKKTRHDELKIDNNSFTYTIALEPYDIEFANYELDYDELSKEIEHPVGAGTNTATVTLPSLTNATWDDSYMTGALNVDILDTQRTISNAAILEKSNESVYEQSTSVSRRPIMEGTILRSDYGDNPPSKYASNNKSPVIHEMLVKYKGNVARPYKYHSTHSEYCCTNEDGSYHYVDCNSCSDLNSSGTATGKFTPGEDRITVKTKIYNGRKSMPHVAARVFKKAIDNNMTTSLKKTIWWESEAYPLLVHRWMKDVHVDGTYDETDIQGQYERIFTQQNKATIEWNVQDKMSQILKEDRDNARAGKRNKSDYPHVPFATDRDLQRFDYPFKSGYYFNPIGTYKVKIRTEIFKDEIGETKEHKALVDSQIASFNFGSNMQYNLEGVGQLRMKFDDPEVDQPVLKYKNNILLEANRDYQYIEEIRLEHSPKDPVAQHKYFKEILEGYSESNTGDSLTNYKYQEFIQDGQEIYKIIEETTVTFVVNPDNTMLKTYGGMKNGTYYMTAWVEDQNISSITNVADMIVKGINKEKNLDEVKITVMGSMYDDLNN